jgi:bile acid:Na+ symporter, BASS family
MRAIAVLHSLELAAQISVIAFVVLSMFSAGLTLSIQQVSEPFKSTRLLISALAANFVLVPLSAYLITRAIPLEQSLVIALLLLGTASGAPLLPKLV